MGPKQSTATGASGANRNRRPGDPQPRPGKGAGRDRGRQERRTSTGRMSTGWLAASVVAAAVALPLMISSGVWFVSMLSGETAGFAVLAAGAFLACLALACAIPVLRSLRLPGWLVVLAAVVLGAFGIVAAFGLWTISTLLLVCDYACRPVDTWKMLPVLLACGILSALGPAIAALGLRRDRIWVAAVIFGLAGFAVALFFWVEGAIY